MADQRLSEITREKLYELVWTTPVARLAERYGISGVAFAKRCKKLAVPLPERGYWAKIEFGKKVNRPDLPVSPAEDFVTEALKPVETTAIPSPEPHALHPLASQLLEKLRMGKVSYDGQRVHIRERELPETEVSKAQADRVANVFDALLKIVEPRGIPFRRAQSTYDGGFFRKGNDRLYFKIEEELTARVGPGYARTTFHTGWQQEKKVGAGLITITLNEHRYSRQTEKRWTETNKKSLTAIVATVAKEICRHFVAMQKKRAEDAIQREKNRIESEIRWKKYQEQEAIREKENAKKRHEQALDDTARARMENLVKAVSQWRESLEMERFLSECERRWRESPNSAMTDEQQAWLAWARMIAKARSPFEIGYPDPARDGPFDRTAVPIGGPYPESRTSYQRPSD